MLLKPIFFIGVIACSLIVDAQNPSFSVASVNKGQIIKRDNNDLYREVMPVGKVNGKVVMVARHLSELHPPNSIGKRHVPDIVITDENLTAIKSVSTEKRYEGSDLNFLDAFVTDQRAFLLYSFYNRGHQAQYLLLTEINVESGEVDRRVRLVGKIESGRLRNDDQVTYELAFSPDSSYIALLSRVIKGGDVVNFDLQLFNSTMELLGTCKPQLGLDRWAFVENAVVDNNGTIYVLAFNAYNTGNIPRSHFLIESKPKLGEVKMMGVKASEKQIFSMDVAVNSYNDIVVLGFYCQGNMTNPKGVISFFYQEGMSEVKQVDAKEFSNDVVLKLGGEDGVKSFNKDENYLGLPLNPFDIEVKANSGFLFHGEQSRSSNITQTVSNPTTGAPMTVGAAIMAFNSDIFLVDVSEKGEFNWISIIEKHQVAHQMNLIFNSYSLLHHDNKAYVLFNDLEDGGLLKTGLRGAPLALVVVDENGNQTKEYYDIQGEDKIPHAVANGDLKNVFYLYGRDILNNRFATVTIKN